MEAEIRTVLAKHGRLEVDAHQVPADRDLYECGMTSHAAVNVMLALEEEFDIEFPDSLLRKSTFQTVANLQSALVEAGVSAES